MASRATASREARAVACRREPAAAGATTWRQAGCIVTLKARCAGSGTVEALELDATRLVVAIPTVGDAPGLGKCLNLDVTPSPATALLSAS
jgi:hypothetical protein